MHCVNIPNTDTDTPIGWHHGFPHWVTPTLASSDATEQAYFSTGLVFFRLQALVRAILHLTGYSL